MEFRVLGPVELRSAGQQRALESGKVSGILAMLLLTPGKLVPADDLIDRLWEADPPAGARGNLAVYVSRLRASLRQAGGHGVTLTGRASGYVLDVDPEDVDVHQFRRLRQQGGMEASAGRSAEAVRLLRDADPLWHGEAIAGISGAWFATTRDSLQEERRAAVTKRVELELGLGGHVSLVGEIGALLAQYPMDETLIGFQMTALYRCGRISDALNLFRETRNWLVEDQGSEPGWALAELHHRILRQDPGLSARPTRMTPGGVRLTALFKPSSQRRCALGALADHRLAAAGLSETATARSRLRATCPAPDQSARLGSCGPFDHLRRVPDRGGQGERNPGAIGSSCMAGHRHERARERHISMTSHQIALTRVAPAADGAGHPVRARRPQGVGRGPGSHLCPARGCRQHVSPDRLMCRLHWYRVPKPLRDIVWATWRSGAGVGTPEHIDAILAAVAAAVGPAVS
jgi:DNA-binding SARP family transcriptional activator